MTKHEIIEELAKNKVVEKIVKHYRTEYPEDLVQIVYVFLLEKEDDVIQDLYEKGELNYYIQSIIWTQLSNPTTKYYYQTKKFQADSRRIDDKYDDFPIEENLMPEQLIPIREYLTDEEWEFLIDLYELSGLHNKKEERLMVAHKYHLKNRKAMVYKREKIFAKLKKKFKGNLPNAFVNGRIREGSHKPRATLWKPVSQYDMEGNFIATYQSIGEAEKITGVKQPNISANLRGVTRMAGNYLWRYAEDDKK